MVKKWTVIAAILGAMLLITGYTGACSSPSPSGKLSVINHNMTREESGAVEVQVTVKNVGPVVAELAEVSVSFYDASKNLIDISSDSVLNLRPGETWEFEIACQGERCSQVKSYDIETMAGTSSGGSH
jgi:FlaG/FlaF family flagellin (archaellin)